MGTARAAHLSLVMALALAGSGAHAEVYRWKDSSGRAGPANREPTQRPRLAS